MTVDGAFFLALVRRVHYWINAGDSVRAARLAKEAGKLVRLRMEGMQQ